MDLNRKQDRWRLPAIRIIVRHARGEAAMFGVVLIAGAAMAHGSAATDLGQPARLRNPQAVVSYEDYPAAALRTGDYGIVSMLLRVSPEGKMLSCDVTETSGSTTLDLTSCSLLRKRARFYPARDAAGLPIEGDYRLASIWGVGANQPRTTFDLSLQVSAVPADYRSPVKARLLFDAQGRVAACDITTSSGSVAADQAACTSARQQLVIAAPKSASENIPSAAIRYLTASLSTAADRASGKR